MTVYLVNDSELKSVEGVFSTPELAREFIARETRLGPPDDFIEEHEVDWLMDARPVWYAEQWRNSPDPIVGEGECCDVLPESTSSERVTYAYGWTEAEARAALAVELGRAGK